MVLCMIEKWGIPVQPITGKKPRTVCRMTDTGRRAFEDYVQTVKLYLHL